MVGDEIPGLPEAVHHDSAEVAAALAGLRTRGLVGVEPIVDGGSTGVCVTAAPAASRRELTPLELKIIDRLLGAERDPRHPHVSATPGICGGAPVIGGTRIPAEMVAGYFFAGKGVADVQRDFPYLRDEEVLDALASSCARKSV